MYKSVYPLVLITFLSAGIALLVFFYNSHDLKNWPNDYAVVIDAGSSGTRAFLYEWKANFSAKIRDDLKIVERAKCTANDKGINKLKNKQEFVDKISPCLKMLQEEIPKERMSRAYIFLAATAGMRLLESMNKTASDTIFGYIRSYFKETEFLFKNDSQVRILNGQEEGINAWISANYFNDKFKRKPGQPVITSETTGVLDLGGASTQIVFVPESSNPADPSLFSTIRIYGIDYKPYSYSFLCWGQNEIAFLYQTYLISKANYLSKAAASCYPKDHTETVESDQLIGSPCSNGVLTSKKMPFTEETINRMTSGSFYELDGKSDMDACDKEIQHMFPKTKCDYESCSFNNVYMPSISKNELMGFSGFYYSILNTEKLFNQKVSSDYNLFVKLTLQLCMMTLKELQNLNSQSGANLPQSFLTNQCFTNVYMRQLLNNYGIYSFDALKVTDKVNGYKLNWALGYLINELNRDDFLPYEEPPRKLNFPHFVSATVLLSLCILASVAGLLYYKLYYKRSLRRMNPEMQGKESPLTNETLLKSIES